jgi:hypothetical protein
MLPHHELLQVASEGRYNSPGLLAQGILREQLAIMREVGFDDAEIRQFIWSRLGPALHRLGHHQDTGLIEGPMDKDEGYPSALF